jgi:putative DNA primase/helicase
MALHSHFGESGWTLFDKWSNGAANYNADENQKRWNSFTAEVGIGIGSIFHMARERGFTESPAVHLNGSPSKPATEAGKPHLTFPPVESWPESVSTAEMLEAITGEIRRYCALPEHGDVIAALWAMWTYVFDEFTTSPMLRVTSPTKRCGKTTLLDFMARICHRPLPASNCSPAALFRVIERDQPTLLLDEADTFFGSNPDLVGIINSGHTKAAAYVIRMVGEGKNMEPRQFSTWAPKLIAGIGRVTDTIEDRSIVLELKRKPASERLARVSRFDATELRARLNRWAEDAANDLRRDHSDFSELANDRANDNWHPLIAIAGTAGDAWRRKAIAAAHASSSAPGEGEDSIAIQLLADLRGVFAESLADRMASAELASALHEMEGRLWSEFGPRQRPISPNQVARLLKPFGVLPRSMKLDQRVCRGYFKDDFTEAFSLYVPSPHDSNRYLAITPENIAENGDFHPLPRGSGSTPDTGVSTNKHRVCSAVAVRSHPADKEAAVYV